MPGAEKIKIALESEEVDTGEISEEMEGEMPTPEEEGGPAGGGGGTVGDAMGGLMDGIMNMSMTMGALLGGVMAIVGVLLSMEPIQKLMKGFMKVVQAFFAPLAMMLIKLLSPVLRWMIKLLPKWFAFFKDPVGVLTDFGEWLWKKLKAFPKWLWSALNDLGGWLWKQVQKIPGLIFKLIVGYLKIWMKIGKILWGALQKLGTWLWGKLKAGWDILKNIAGILWNKLQELGSWIWGKLKAGWEVLKNIGGVLWNKLQDLGDWIWGKIKSGINFITKLPQKIWDFMVDLPGLIWDKMRQLGSIISDAIGGLFGKGSGKWEWTNPKNWQTGGVVRETGIARVHSGEAVINRQDFQRLLNELRNNRSGDTNIELSGGIGDFVEVKQKNRNIR